MSNLSSLKGQIVQALEQATGVKNPEVDFSSNESFGDYSTNVALKNKDLDVNAIVQKINRWKDLPAKASAKGRFINFWLKNDVLVDNLIDIDRQKDDFGRNLMGKNKTAIV